MASSSELENWSLEKWLKKMGLRKYKQAFIDNGYDTADLCANLHKEDLDAIGVNNKTSRSTLFTQSRKLMELFQKEGLLASEEVIVERPSQNQQSSPKPSNHRHSNSSSSSSSSPKEGGRKNLPPGKLSLESPTPNNNDTLPGYSEPWNSSNNPLPPTTTNAAAAASSAATVLAGGIQNLPDYSEPWNSNSASSQPTSPTSKTPKFLGGETTTDGGGPPAAVAKSPAHRQLSGGQAATLPNSGTPKRKPPVSPGPTSDLPPFKKTGSSGLTRLQLKLKIREELFTRGVVLTEHPYCREVSLY